MSEEKNVKKRILSLRRPIASCAAENQRKQKLFWVGSRLVGPENVAGGEIFMLINTSMPPCFLTEGILFH